MRTASEIEDYAHFNGMNERLMIYGARQIMLNSQIEACEAAIAAERDAEAARHESVKLDVIRAEMRSVVEHARQVEEAAASERRQSKAAMLSVGLSVFTKQRAKVAAVVAGIFGLMVAAGCEAARLASAPCAHTSVSQPK